MAKKMWKNSLFAMLGILALLVGMSCGDDDEVVTSKDITPLVCFKVNDAGTGFVNTGTSGSTYAATNVGGSFGTSAGGQKVFNTGGTVEGYWICPWFNDLHWDRYINVGYVDLGAATGDLIASLDNWTVECIFALPSDCAVDIVDRFIWSFVDGDAVTDDLLGFNWREMYVRSWQGASLPEGNQGRIQWDSGFATDGWGAAESYRPLAVGTYAHLVVTKKADGTISNYINGALVNENNKPAQSFAAGDFTFNTLGNCPHVTTPAPTETETFGADMAKTKYYQFAIDDKAWSASEVTARYRNSYVAKGFLGAY